MSLSQRMRVAVFVLCGILIPELALGQGATIPATKPTADGPAVVPTVAVAPRRVGRGTTPAQVVYSDGRLEVTANNSGLNQILREIARQTGMKITGGVANERVYGKYGPASPAVVLGQLLDGTGSNMVLEQDASAAPVQLTLSPRTGGPSPPNSSATADDDEPPAGADVAAPQAPAAVPTALPSPEPARLPFSSPPATPAITDTQRTPTTPDPGGIVGAPTVAPATEPGTTPGPQTQSTGTSDQASPNGVKTPQQVFQQLQQLQQQQPATPQ